jgi:DNA modification methylase
MTITTHADNRVTVHHDKCEDVLRTLADASVDSVVTDPPYELGFMGRAWDASGIAYRVDLWEECRRVLKPGGHLLAFGGTRTWHRLTCAIEDAGFEIRDTITWLYGSGFPKSLNVSRAIDLGAGAERPTVRTPYTTNVLMRHGGENTRPWMEEAATRGYHEQADPNTPATEDAARWEGWGTALKPASEPVVVARKPLAGTVAGTVLAYGTGALNIDGCRVATPDGKPAWDYPNGAGGHTFKWNEETNQHGPKTGPAGRWPSNVVLTHAQAEDGGDACADGCVPGCPVADLDAQSGDRPSTGTPTRAARPGVGTTGGYGGALGLNTQGPLYSDEGGASRFFPTFRYEAKADTAQRPRAGLVAHPTVKPLDLMRWLVRLITPPGGLVLDPFAGSGTTGEAAILEGMRAVLIERESDYLPLIADRLTRRTDPAAHLIAKANRGEDVDLGLFAFLDGDDA